MTLTIAENIAHQNSDGVTSTNTSTPITVALAGADTTEDDSFVLVVMARYGTPVGGTLVTVPSGWTALMNSTSTNCAVLYRGVTEGVAAGESSWDFTPAINGDELTWQVYDIHGIAPVEPVEVSLVSSTDVGTGTVKTSTATAQTNSYDNLEIAAHLFRDADNTTPATWGSHSNGFTELQESGQTSGAHSVGLSVSAKPTQTINTATVSATANRTFASNEATSLLFTIMARNAPRQTDMAVMDGAEIGELQGTNTAGVTVTTGAVRSGAYGYALSSTAAACNRTFPIASPTVVGQYCAWRLHFRVPDLADRAQIAVFTAFLGSTTVTLTLRLTSSQLGLNWTTGVTSGGEQLSDQTITDTQWVGVAIQLDTRAKPAFTANWAVDYNAELTDTTPAVLQTAVAATAGPTGSLVTYSAKAGWTSALTSAMDVDDYAHVPGYNFPIGDLRILPLKVDPAGTPTISGTSTNFGVMTNNGTVAAWNATNARNAVDDIPPVIGASRDAAVAVLAHATDYAEFPMETVDLAANKVNVRGVKAHWWVWAASATTATIRIFVSDGTTTYTMYAEADPNADNTIMVYGSAMVRGTGTVPDWSQSRVDALAFRFGSNDATPDIGLDAMLLELAVVKALPEDLFGQITEPIYVQAHRDSATYALVGATVTNNSGAAIELTWEVDGVPDSSGSIPDGTVDQYVPLSPDGTIQTVGKVVVIPG